MGLFDSIGSIFGGSQPNNQNFAATAAPVWDPTNNQQMNQQYAGSQQGLGQQQQLISALQGQNGIQNQSNVYNQMQGVANGTGPNPAQAMLANQTGANQANQAAQAAAMRGSSGNVGLMQRGVGQQGSNIQQQAAGQGAALQANQSLNALGQLGGMANNQVQNQMGAVNSFNQSQQNEQQQLLNANQGVNNANVQMQGNMNSTNQQMAANNAKNTAGGIGGLLGGLGSVAGTMFGPAVTAIGGAIGNAIGGGGSSNEPSSNDMSGGFSKYAGGSIPNADGSDASHYKSNKKLDKVPMKDRYPEHIEHMQTLYHGGYTQKAPMPMKQGGPVPGQAEVRGDSPKNDTVQAKLSPGEVVIPKSVMESKDPVGEASKFVAALMKKKGGASKSPEGDFKEALGRAIQGRKKK
jgi:hypothetical protein